MSAETQTFADLMVLGMTDEAVLQSIEYHLEKYDNGCGADHLEIADQLITALDNVYGVGSYAKWLRANVLPSQQ